MFRSGIASFAAVALLGCLRGGAAQHDGTCTNGAVADIGNGRRDAANNKPSCGYDGGDCCVCSCSGSVCAINVFDRLDPDAEDGFFDCKAPPPAALSCSAEVQRTWVVDDLTQAEGSAAAVNCSGGRSRRSGKGG